MKRIKKSIAVIVACLLMSSNLNANTNFFSIDCAQLAIDTYNNLIDNYPNLSVDQCNSISISVWDDCDALNQ